MSQCFELSRRVAFSETDMAGVMHFSNYFRWMEDVECAFWRSLGQGEFVYYDDGVLCWPRISVACHYRAPLRFEQEALVRLNVAAMTGKTLRFSIEVSSADRTCAAGSMTVVCCRLQDGEFRSLPIPDKIRELLHPYVQSPRTESTA